MCVCKCLKKVVVLVADEKKKDFYVERLIYRS